MFRMDLLYLASGFKTVPEEVGRKIHKMSVFTYAYQIISCSVPEEKHFCRQTSIKLWNPLSLGSKRPWHKADQSPSSTMKPYNYSFVHFDSMAFIKRRCNFQTSASRIRRTSRFLEIFARQRDSLVWCAVCFSGRLAARRVLSRSVVKVCHFLHIAHWNFA